MKPKVFLSHSSIDIDRVRIIKTVLENEGIECWLDTEMMQPGDTITQGIQKGLNDTDFVIFFVSSASLESSWVELEIASSLVMQMKKRVPRVIPAKLEDVELPELLQNIVSADLTDEKSIEGATLLARTIHSHFEIISQALVKDDKASKRIPENLPKELQMLAGVRPKEGFHWIILSGASSSGKDVLGYLLDQHLSIDYELDIAIKYTTRPRRQSEPVNIISISENDFLDKEKSGDILFSYKKREYLYGFDLKQFKRAIMLGYPLVSIFTHLKLVPEITKLMNTNGYPTTPFFIDVPRKDLLRRVAFRNFSENELGERVRSIDMDLTQIIHRDSFEDEYILLANGDDTAINTSAKKLSDIVVEKINGGQRESNEVANTSLN